MLEIKVANEIGSESKGPTFIYYLLKILSKILSVIQNSENPIFINKLSYESHQDMKNSMLSCYIKIEIIIYNNFYFF